MYEAPKRSLRIRRPPAYFGAEIEEADQMGYQKQAYNKEYVSPAQELNNLAKFLSKFVNSANKRNYSPNQDLRQASKNDEVEDKPHIANEPLFSQKESKKNVMLTQGAKKKVAPKIETKDDGLKKSKELYSYKDQISQQKVSKEGNKNQESSTKEQQKPKQQNYSNLYSDMMGAQYLSMLNQINYQQQMAAMSNLQRNATSQALIHQQQMLMNSNPFMRQQLMPMQSNHQKVNINKDKLFGRAAFHVAIAYHIHLKKIKESGADITSQSLLDPTYNAKKLKGGYQQKPKQSQHKF